MIKLGKDRPEVPACIRLIQTRAEPGNPDNAMIRSPSLAAFIAGKPVGLDEVWTVRGRGITEAEYERALNDLQWDGVDPATPINRLTSRLPF